MTRIENQVVRYKLTFKEIETALRNYISCNKTVDGHHGCISDNAHFEWEIMLDIPVSVTSVNSYPVKETSDE